MSCRPPEPSFPRAAAARVRPFLALLVLAAAAGAQLDGSGTAHDTAALLPRPVIATPVPVERRLDAHLEFLASDDLGGRETGTVHALVTAQYVAAAFRSAGLLPAGENGTYFQQYPLSANRLVLEETSLAVSGPKTDTLALRLFDDFLVRGYGDRGFDAAGDVVFADYGISSAPDGVDDYASLDVTDRFVLAFDGRPKSDNRDYLRSASTWRAKRDAAKARGAVGLLLITRPGDNSGRGSLETLAEQARHPTFSVPDGEAPAPAWPVVMLKEGGAAAIFAAAGLSLETERALREAALVPGGKLAGVRVTLKAPVVAESTHADNIAGLVRGSDPAVADEVVIVSAHNDHIGILKDGRINNGADDNASGTATLLTVAEILAAGPAPRRSVLFLSVSGEEKGLWGSSWWCEHPTVPLERCIADINIDMVGRNDPDAVGVTPSPAHEDYNSIVARAVELGPANGLHVTWTAPAAGEDKVDNYFERSDHYNFAAKGIPVAFFFSGLHEDYHKPTDTLDKLNRDKLYRVVALVRALVADVADAAQRPAKVKSGGG